MSTSEFFLSKLVFLDQAAHGAVHEKDLLIHELLKELRRGCRIVENELRR